jgi:hypothetical protein
MKIINKSRLTPKTPARPDEPMARRRRSSTDGLTWKLPLRGREVTGQRPRGPAPRTAIVFAKHRITISFFDTNLRIFRLCRSGEGRTALSDSEEPPARGRQPLRHEAPGSFTAEEDERCHQNHSDHAAVFTAPPAGTLDAPTLYTRRGSGFPHPPAAGAVGGGPSHFVANCLSLVRTMASPL